MMGLLREDIVQEARRWLGTPYRSRHYPVMGQACDCASFLLGVGLGAGVFAPGTRMPVYAADRHLHRSDEAYREQLRAHGFVEIAPANAQLGDVLLLVMGQHQPASHTAIVTDCNDAPTRIVHASRPVGRVCEHGIDARWRGRVRFAFRFPGIDA